MMSRFERRGLAFCVLFFVVMVMVAAAMSESIEKLPVAVRCACKVKPNGGLTVTKRLQLRISLWYVQGSSPMFKLEALSRAR